MSRPWNNGTDVTVGYMNPQKPVGTVVFNARINSAIASQGKTNPNPLFKHALGSSADNMDYVEDGDLLYTFAGSGASIQSMSRSSQRNDYTAIQCLSVLNGQGERGESVDALMSKLEFVGVCEMGTKTTGNTLFNAVKRGIRTMLNNGHEVIPVGSHVQWYVPTEAERKNGGRGLVVDANGEAKLQLKVFNVAQHKHTPKALYDCLDKLRAAGWNRDVMATANVEDSYSLEFIEQAEAFLESAIQMSIIIGMATAGVDDEAAAVDGYRRMSEDAATKSRILDALFAQYMEDWDAAATPRGPSLKRFKAEAAGLHLYATGALCGAVESRKIGKAMTTGMPKHNLSVHLK